MCIRKKVLKRLNCYNEDYKNSGLENYELIIKAINNGFIGKLIDLSLFSYRVHSCNMSTTRRQAIIEYGTKLMLEQTGLKFRTNSYHPFHLKLDQ